MASSRRLPTSYNTSTYGNATRDYTSLATWEAATDNDLVTATNGEVLECYDDATSFDDSVEIAEATTSSSYFRVIKPADGEGHDGTPNNGVTFITTSASNVAFILQEDNSQLHDLIGSTQQSINGFFGVFNAGSKAGIIVGCIVFDSPDFLNGAFNTGRSIAADYDIEFINCIAINCSAGFRVKGGSGSVCSLYNCTAVNCTTGFVHEGGTAKAKNCISYNNTTDFSGTWTKTTCYEGDATVFANQAGDDYHLGTTDTTARGNGTDLSGDGTYAFDDDIDRDTRSTWDIGFDEFSSAGWTGKIIGITNPAKINGIAVANITSVNGIA